jgi:hypothetical protein
MIGISECEWFVLATEKKLTNTFQEIPLIFPKWQDKKKGCQHSLLLPGILTRTALIQHDPTPRIATGRKGIPIKDKSSTE